VADAVTNFVEVLWGIGAPIDVVVEEVVDDVGLLVESDAEDLFDVPEALVKVVPAPDVEVPVEVPGVVVDVD